MCTSESYTYDAWGNLLTLGPNTTTQPNYVGCTQESGFTYSIATNNRLAVSGFSYDAAGNMTASPGATYTYDAENHLITTHGVTYAYDGDGKRLTKSSGMMYWYGLSSDPLIETDLSSNLKAHYIFFNGQRVASENSSNSVDWYFADHLGTARLVFSLNGDDQSDFYPFGGERVITTGANNHYKFTGKERDAESGLDNFGARYDASSMGRFMTPDPLGGHGTDPHTLNKYAYVRDNPLNLTDPTGLDFYLKCGTDTHITCTQAQTDPNDKKTQIWVEANDDGTAKIVTSDSIRSGDNTATVGVNGVQINGTEQGIYFDNPASHTTDSNGNDVNHNAVDLKGQGDVLGNFTFHVDRSDVASGNLAGGSFSFTGTGFAMRQLLNGSGGFSYGFGLENGLDLNAHHPGMLNFRFSPDSLSAKLGSNVGPSLHLTISIDPALTVTRVGKTGGDFHVDNQTGLAHNSCANSGGACQ